MPWSRYPPAAVMGVSVWGRSRTICLCVCFVDRVRNWRPVVTGHADRWIRRTTTGCVAFLALIAATVSYLPLHMLVEVHGQPGWVAALTPFSVDGMIVAASTTLLADSRAGERGGMLPWALLAVGSAASLAANVAVAQPTTVGRAIAAWPSFALIGAYVGSFSCGRRPWGVRLFGSLSARRAVDCRSSCVSIDTRAQGRVWMLGNHVWS